MMFQRIRNRAADMRTIAKLCQNAEQNALSDGLREPGAEHFLLAAYDLPDGTAASVFLDFGIDRATIVSAIEGQYGDALAGFGIGQTEGLVEGAAEDSIGEVGGLYSAAPSGRTVMQALASLPRVDGKPLQGVDVLIVLASQRHGTVPRAFRRLGIELDQLAQAAMTKRPGP
jgi:hypothetical protein